MGDANSLSKELCGTLAVDPAAIEDIDRCEGATVSGQVKSHAKHLPSAQGTKVAPSGLMRLEQIRPPGSSSAGISALGNDGVDGGVTRDPTRAYLYGRIGHGDQGNNRNTLNDKYDPSRPGNQAEGQLQCAPLDFPSGGPGK